MSPQISIQQPSPRDVFKYVILMAFILLVFAAFSQKTVLLPGDSYEATDTAVVMSFYEYTGYYLARKGYDSLNILLPKYLDQTDSLSRKLVETTENYRQIVTRQSTIIENQSVITEALQDEKKTLIKENRKHRIKTALAVTANGLTILALLLL